MTLSPATTIRTGSWRSDMHPLSIWAGEMTDEGYPNAPLELEIYGNGRGILRTVYGWFPAKHFSSSKALTFDLDAAHKVRPNALDEKIIARAASILSKEEIWNRSDNRKCPINAKSWSIYCAMEKATTEVTGEFHHRRPALEVVRQIVDERTSMRDYKHRLMDYNNDPSTTPTEVKSLFAEALKRIRQK